MVVEFFFFSFSHQKNCLEKLWGRNPERQGLKRFGSGENERPSPEHDLPNHVDLMANFDVRGRKTLFARFGCRGQAFFVSNQRDLLVGHVRGSDAPYLLNQGVSDIDLLDFLIIYETIFLASN
jgi:hypothetical protein